MMNKMKWIAVLVVAGVQTVTAATLSVTNVTA